MERYRFSLIAGAKEVLHDIFFRRIVRDDMDTVEMSRSQSLVDCPHWDVVIVVRIVGLNLRLRKNKEKLN